METTAHKNIFYHFDLYANCSFKRQQYKANTGTHGVQRTGQQKLFYADLMACIAYVSEYNTTPAFVVVAGGAPGVHFIKLAKMLPCTIQWHLYDPECFEGDLEVIANVHLHKQLYTMEDSRKWVKERKVLFLSDIRNVNYTPTVEKIQKLSHELARIPRHTRKEVERKKATELGTRIRHLRREVEDMALEDMKNQAQMVRHTEAEMSFVKFRLPYASHRAPQFYSYLKGTVLFQPWNRCNSTECRLMVTPVNAHTYKREQSVPVFQDVCYDILKHEEQCAFINNNLRPEWDTQGIRILEAIYETVACQKKENPSIHISAMTEPSKTTQACSQK
jgi:hypothetical protein